MEGVVDIAIAGELGIDFFSCEVFLPFQHQEGRAFAQVQSLPVGIEGAAGGG